MSINRRQFVLSSVAGSMIPMAAGKAFAQGTSRKRRAKILLRSSWQTVNIGDIAHSPGVLRLLQIYLPEVDVVLWPSKLDNGVNELLTSNFPNLKTARSTAELETAFAECDFLLHGSGPSLVAENHVVKWSKETGKPYGVYGITLSQRRSAKSIDETPDALRQTIDVLSGAEFVFFRDSKSLKFARSLGCHCPVMEFGPDGAFACDLRDDVKAEEFLRTHELEEGKFLCCIPKLRYTPYWTIPSKNRPFDPVRHARNEAMKEHDHAPLREAIVQVIRQTDLKVLLCPEDQTQMQVGKELLLEKLPNDVRRRVVWRSDYWLTDEAISTYIRSAGLFGNEQHSPIMCIGHGIPAIVCRWAEQTWKGIMWKDIGLAEWLFDMDDESQTSKIVPAVLELAQDPQRAKTKADEARRFVEKRQQETMARVAMELA